MKTGRLTVRSRRGGVAKPVVLFVTAIAIAIVLHLCLSSNKPDATSETREETNAQAAKDFTAKAEADASSTAAPVARKKPDKKEIAKLIESLPGRAAADEIKEIFDADRYMEELADHEQVQAIQYARRSKVLELIRPQAAGPFESISENLPPHCEIVTIRIDSRHDVALATTIHYGLDVPTEKLRWWLHHSKGQWRIFDVEDLNLGVKVSAFTADVLHLVCEKLHNGIDTLYVKALEGQIAQHAAKMKRDDIFQHYQRAVRKAGEAGRAKDWDKALSLMLSYSPSEYTDTIIANHWLDTAYYYLQANEPAAALDCIKRSADTGLNMPGLKLMSAQAYNALGEHDKAIDSARSYIETLGEDADANWEIAKAMLAKGAKPVALQSLRKAAGMASYRGDILADLVIHLPSDDKGVLADYAAKMKYPAEGFAALAPLLLKAEDFEGLQVAVKAFESRMPNSASVLLYSAKLHLHEGKLDEALDVLDQAARKVDEQEECDLIHDTMMDVLLDADQPLRAYHSCPDTSHALTHICEKLLTKADTAALTQVIKAHATKAGEERMLHFYRGQLHMLQGKWAEATQDLIEAKPDRDQPELYERSRSACVEAAYKSGSWHDGYNKFRDRQTSFSQLAFMMAADKDLASLQKLINRHKKSRMAMDENHYLWMSWIDLQKGRHKWGAQRLIAKRQRILWPEGNAYDERTADMVADTLVRLLLRANEPEKAVAEAKICGLPRYIAVAAAAAGDAESLEESLSAFCTDGGSVEIITDDPDVKAKPLSKDVQAILAKYSR